MKADILRLGLVGADASGKGWGPAAHIPALRGLEQIELVALCTSSPESAAAAAQAYGIDRAYHDVNELVAQPDIDIIAVVVQVPSHHEIVMAALNAGKHVYCEWPLGTNLTETQELAERSRANNLVTAIGLQGRHDPSLNYIKELYNEGWLGEILSINMTMLTRGTPERPSRQVWESEINKYPNQLMMIAGGHTLDYLNYCFGPLVEVSAKVATRVQQLHIVDTGEKVDVEAADHVLFTGTLDSGALVSYQVAAVPFNADGWRMAVYGSKGTIIASTQLLPQITPITLVGAQGNKPLTELPVPERLRVIPNSVPEGPPRNVGQLYVRMAEAIHGGTKFHPNFEDALKIHELLESIQLSSDEGRVVKVGLLPLS